MEFLSPCTGWKSDQWWRRRGYALAVADKQSSSLFWTTRLAAESFMLSGRFVPVSSSTTRISFEWME
jgi:hypothetical protein